jgi:type I restriction enzyme S subunit
MDIDTEIPADWKKRTIREVGNVITGRTPSTQHVEFYGGDYNLISPADLDGGKYVVTAHKRLTRAGFDQCRALPRDTVLVGCIGNVGKLGLVSDERSATNQQINAVICNSDHDPHFLYYRLYEDRGRLERAAVKTTVPILNKTNFETFEIAVPPLPEQRKIAAVLGLVQRAIEQQERLIALTTQLKKTLLHKLFTEGLRGEPQKQTEIGPVPKSWEVVLLKDCSVVQTGVAKGRKLDGKDTVTLPYLRVANVQAGFLDLREMKTITIHAKEKSRYLLQNGDVVLTEGGDFDKLGRGFIWTGEIDDSVHQNHIFAVRVHRSRLLPEFFAHLSQSPYGKKYFLSVAHKTTNLACINTTKLKGFPVLIPTAEEQREIVDILEAVDAQVSAHQRKWQSLSDLFRTLLHQLMTAQIRVHDLDLDEILQQPVAEFSDVLSPNEEHAGPGIRAVQNSIVSDKSAATVAFPNRSNSE